MNSIQWRVFSAEEASASWEELDLILTRRSLTAHFQPILRTRDLSVFGWEALIRGPATSTLARPDALFAAARHCGRLSELDYACRATSIGSFAAQREATAPAGKLFLNVDPTAFVEGARKGWTRELLAAHGLLPANVVIEITEASPHASYDDLCEATEHYRSQGFEIAIDDLGEAYASLRVWSEVRPNYVKIDRHFIHAAATEPSVRRLLEMIVSLSYDVGSMTIAEGVETETQWQLMHQLGFDCVQGFLFASPAPQLLRALPASIRQSLLQQVVRETRWFGSTRTVAAMAKPVEPVTLTTDNETVYRRFLADAGLTAIPVVDDGRRPIGLIARQRFLEDFSRPYRHELFGRRSCGHYVAKGRIIAAQTTIHELTRYFQTLDLTELGCPFVIVDDGGRYVGMGDGQALLRTLVEVQLEAARYANPLTGLPGSVPINDRIEQYLARSLPFVVGYVDISHFKAYNDVYGFVEGDEMIRMVAELLRRHTPHPDDFVGHIGGDDFIVLWADPDWEKRVAALFDSFATALPAFYRPGDWQQGGINAEDRQGNRVFHPVSALTIGAVRVLPGVYDSHRSVAAAATEAKKMAKKLSQRQAAQGILPANVLFVERRRPGKKS